jgi:hypothetical protein
MSFDFTTLDIVTEVERWTSTRLRPASASGKQWVGACPYEDCPVDDDGFVVWPHLTERHRHYFCRGCHRAGTILTLVQEIRGLSREEAIRVLTGHAVSSVPSPPRLSRARQRQREEVETLNQLAPHMQQALRHPRARAYLQQRGIPRDLAQTLGLGYLPPFERVPSQQRTPRLLRMRRWCDRLLFPLQAGIQTGWSGRTLALWEPGMAEHEQQRRLEAYNQQVLARYGQQEGRWMLLSRWKTTAQGGVFVCGDLSTSEQVVLVEGPWDACALMAAGVPQVLATCGLQIDLATLPKRAYRVVLAFDGDARGQEAMQHWQRRLRRKGFDVCCCAPPQDGLGKDWSERWVRVGPDGVAPVLRLC